MTFETFRSKRSNNTGHKYIYFYSGIQEGKKYQEGYFVSIKESWVGLGDRKRRQITKSFSTKKYGKREALRLAKEWRNLAIKELGIGRNKK